MAILEQAAFNVAAAAGLAPIAFASRWLNRPALTHSLWLIVLARLVMPTVWPVSMPLAAPAEQFTTLEAAPIETLEPTTTARVEAAIEPSEPQAYKAVISEPPVAVHESTDPPAVALLNWRAVLVGLWASGASLYALLILIRSLHFRRTVAMTAPTETELIDRVAKLSRRVGLRRPPRVMQSFENVTPCVWTHGARPVLLLARDFSSFSRLQQAAIIVHELAHLRRRDHWVRWFEVLVTAFYWWLPVVWIARRELRAAEELCCDEWVVATLPAARRAYADALVDTVDLVAGARPALPTLASGLGGVRELKRRIHMILGNKPAGRPGKLAAALTLGAALVVLPWGLAQPPRGDDGGPPPERRKDRDGPPPEKGDKGPFRKGKDGPPRDGDGPPPGDKMRRRGDAPAGEIERLRMELEDMHRLMERMQRRLRELEGGPGRGDGDRRGEPRREGPPPRPDGDRRGAEGDEHRRAVEAERRAVDAARRAEEEGRRRRIEATRREFDKERKAPPPPRDDGDAPRPPAPPRPPRDDGDAPRPPAPPRPPRGGQGEGEGERRSPEAAQRRIAELEKEVAELRQILTELRKERERRRD